MVKVALYTLITTLTGCLIYILFVRASSGWSFQVVLFDMLIASLTFVWTNILFMCFVHLTSKTKILTSKIIYFAIEVILLLGVYSIISSLMLKFPYNLKFYVEDGSIYRSIYFSEISILIYTYTVIGIAYLILGKRMIKILPKDIRKDI